MITQFTRQIIAVEIKLGFLFIPAHGVELMPSTSTKIKVSSNNEEKEVTYNAEHKRIFGLTSWYKAHKVQPKDEVTLVKTTDNTYQLLFNLPKTKPVIAEIKDEEEAEETLDISGLPSQAKGDIVEDRIKELLLLHGQGLLNVYKPVIDNEGIDLIVVRNGQFHPIFIQVKGRFNLHQDRSLILSVKVKTFNAHGNYYVVGAFFNPKTLELDENLLLIPSKELVKNAIKVNSKNGEWYRVVTSLVKNNTGKWNSHVIKKNELATKLLEKFEEMQEYIR